MTRICIWLDDFGFGLSLTAQEVPRFKTQASDSWLDMLADQLTYRAAGIHCTSTRQLN